MTLMVMLLNVSAKIIACTTGFNANQLSWCMGIIDEFKEFYSGKLIVSDMLCS